MGAKRSIPREELLRAALEAAARLIQPDARVTNPRYRDEEMEYFFDIETARGKVGVVGLSRVTADDLLDKIMGLLG